jgi:hypothetical protein
VSDDQLERAFKTFAETAAHRWHEAVTPFLAEVSAWVETNRDQIETYLAHRPHPLRLQPQCHCFCGHTHGDEMGICDAFAGTTVRRFGDLDVPMCLPCAAALDERRSLTSA